MHECVCASVSVCMGARTRACVCVCASEDVCMDIKNMCVYVCMVYVCAYAWVLPLDEFFICTVMDVQSRYTSHMIIQVR